MKISGFSFIRNAVENDYPLKEAISSILPLCDDFILALGKSNDRTEEYVKTIAPEKIKIIPSIWDDTLKVGGKVFALETIKAMDAIPHTSDWAFYIQADECVHEKYLPVIQSAMEQYKDDPMVDGLLFNYLHFYGSYDYVGSSRRWYRKEIRVIKNDLNIRSYRDAQGFRKAGKKLNVKQIDAWIYHYGWAQTGQGLKKKVSNFSTFYIGPDENQQETESLVKQSHSQPAKESGGTEGFDYSNADRLLKFSGTHPKVMEARIMKAPLTLPPDVDQAGKNMDMRRRILQKVEDLTGYRIGEYKNYNII